LLYATTYGIIQAMTQRDKLRRRIEDNPNAVRFEELNRD
jgi:hypothetical protein